MSSETVKATSRASRSPAVKKTPPSKRPDTSSSSSDNEKQERELSDDIEDFMNVPTIERARVQDPEELEELEKKVESTAAGHAATPRRTVAKIPKSSIDFSRDVAVVVRKLTPKEIKYEEIVAETEETDPPTDSVAKSASKKLKRKEEIVEICDDHEEGSPEVSSKRTTSPAAVSAKKPEQTSSSSDKRYDEVVSESERDVNKPAPKDTGKLPPQPSSSSAKSSVGSKTLTAATIRKVKKENTSQSTTTASKKKLADDNVSIVDLTTDRDDDAEEIVIDHRVQKVVMSAVVYREHAPQLLGHTRSVLTDISYDNPFIQAVDNSKKLVLAQSAGKLNLILFHLALRKTSNNYHITF
jgi:hypothetical protein